MNIYIKIAYSQYALPFKNSGKFVIDANGQKLCECPNSCIAKVVAKAMEKGILATTVNNCAI